MITIRIYKKGLNTRIKREVKGIKLTDFSINPDGILLKFNREHGVYEPILDGSYTYDLIIKND